MKKTKLLLNTIALFAFLNTVNAQQLEQEIISFVDDTEILINNGRRMMLQYVQVQNFERIAEIHYFLNERTSMYNCTPFIFQEELDIALLTNNWSLFLTKAANFADAGGVSLCPPVQDWLLFRALRTEIENNVAQLVENIMVADLTLEEKQLLKLYLHLAEHGNDEAYRQILRGFRRQHPESEHSDFVRTFLPRGQIRGGMGLNLGASQPFLTSGLSDYFSPTTAFNISLDFSFNRILLGFQADAGSVRLNRPLLSSETGYEYDFQEGDRLLFENYMFPIGYTLIRNNRFEITPYVGLGGTVLRSNTTGIGRDRQFDVVNSFTVSPGLRAEFWLRRFLWTDQIGDSLAHGLSLRFDVGYSMPVRFNYTPARGNVFYARAGIVWWLGSIATP